jgi:hypothetical protein
MTTTRVVRDITVTFTDSTTETFVGVSETTVDDGVLRLFVYGPGPARVWALPLIGVRMWTRELA